MVIPVLQFKSITKEFLGVTALKSVSFDVNISETLAVLGSNGAGKTTLMNVLGGNLSPSSGSIIINGQEVSFNSPQDALSAGIGFVHQEIALFPTMTITENLFINSYESNSLGLLSRKSMEEKCVSILKSLNCNLHPRTLVKYLGAGDQQMVEIARALLLNPKILILDEPTSSLANKEKQRLFETVKVLKKKSVAVIYITHFLDEVFAICDRAVIMRNGEYVADELIGNLSYKKIVTYMLGEENSDIEYSRKNETELETDILCVNKIESKGILENISFSVKVGEIYGLWGLLGSGRTEFFQSLVGLDHSDEYDVEVLEDGKMVSLSKSSALNFFGYVTENRRENGLLLPLSILKNMSLANLRSYASSWSFLNDKRIKNESEHYVEELGIVIANTNQAVETLSGGNQQKVIVGKWLQRSPKVLLLDEPTRGLDVGAKRDIHEIINEFVKNASAVLLVTSDIDEMMALADRIAVIDRGKIVGEFDKGVTKEELIGLASGASEVIQR